MFFLIYSLLSLKEIRLTKKNSQVFNALFLFGFESGGNYSVNVENCGAEKLLLFIATQKEMVKCKNEQIINHQCNSKMSILQQIKIVNGSGNFTGTVNIKGVYLTKIISFKKINESFEITYQFHNKNSHLSYNYIQYLPTSKIVAFIYTLMMIAWLINWIMYPSTENFVHIFLTIVFALFAFDKILNAIELDLRNQSDESRLIYKVRPFISYMKINVFAETIFMLISHIDKIPNVATLIIILYIQMIALVFVLYGKYAFLREIVFCSLFIFFVASLIFIHKDYIPAPDEEHNYTRNPKHFLWLTNFYIMASYIVFDLTKMLFFYPYYILLGNDVINIVLLFLLEFFYRLKKSNLKNYRFINDEKEIISDFFDEEEEEVQK